MFQTEINAWMQDFSVPQLDWFMIAVSAVGSEVGIAAICIALTFGLNMRLGLSLLLMLSLTGAATGSLKKAFEMPRPVFLDADVGEPGDDTPPPTVFDNGGATTFWSLPKPEAISAVREFHAIEDEGADGLPSGHVASAAALAYGIALLFVPRFGLSLATFWTALMAISRMYLGRHFLADVLFGAVIGLAVVLLTLCVTESFRQKRDGVAARRFALLTLALCFGAFVRVADEAAISMAISVALCLIALSMMDLPLDEAPKRYSVHRVLFAFAMYAIVARLAGALGLEDLFLGDLMVSLLTVLVPLSLTLMIGIRLGWFTRLGLR